MADTRHWTLQDFADRAGTRTTPYPHELDPPALPGRRCQGCGVDISGKRTAQGQPRVYCGKTCQRDHQRVWRQAIEDAAAVQLGAYCW